MARVEVPIVVMNSAGGFVSGASVSISLRATGAAATWYSAETGGTASTAAVATDVNGRVTAWLPRGAYNLTISGTGITTYTEAWDAVPGSDNGGDTLWLPDGVVTNAKIASGVDASKLTTGTLPAARLPAGGVGTTQLASLAVGTSQIANLAVTSGKIAANTIGAGQIAPDAITASELAVDAVGNSELADNSVTLANILAGHAIGGLSNWNHGGSGLTAVGATTTQLVTITFTPTTSNALVIGLGNFAETQGGAGSATFIVGAVGSTDFTYSWAAGGGVGGFAFALNSLTGLSPGVSKSAYVKITSVAGMTMKALGDCGLVIFNQPS